jgi:L-amino acid N-acyltransferase YncA
MTVHIRPAQDADIPAIAAIYAPFVATTAANFELEPPSVEDMLGRWKAVVAGDYPYLAATQHGSVVGYAYASAYHPRPAYRHTVEDSIYVAADRHRQGIGRALLDRLVAACTERGFRQMIAVIGDNTPASIALHAAVGFEPAGRLTAVGFKFGQWRDTTVMQRALGPGDREPP